MDRRRQQYAKLRIYKVLIEIVGQGKDRTFGQQRVSTLMKAQLLAGKDMIIGELLWPDDFSDADITDKALKALGNYYKAIGRRMVPRPQYKVVPSEIRVLTDDGTEIGRWTIVDLAKSLGKEPREGGTVSRGT